MGILDEAIREHLDLKRQHGAGDSELRKLEDEAFGPPARPGEAEAPTAVSDQPPAEPTEPSKPLEAAEEPVAPPPEPEPVAVEEHPAIEHRAVEPGEAEAEVVRAETEEHPPPEPPEEPEDASITDQPTELYDLDDVPPVEEPVVEEEPVEDEFFSEQSLSDELDQALDANETEQAPAPDAEEPPEPGSEEEEPTPEEPEGGIDEAEEEGEDVLEETPEFLQDTPEHDRLWFEQKPPKDFDFDD
jgi:hypothetical protein